MKIKTLIIIIFFFLINFTSYYKAYSQIKNSIVAKVGSSIISEIDIRNEIMTNLVLNKKVITQENIDNNKNYAIKNLINKSIKKSEVDKYQVKGYSKTELNNYILKVAKTFETNTQGLKKIFQNKKINYDVFVDQYVTELRWNTLIFSLYDKQININIIDVKNEIIKISNYKNVEYNLSEIEILNSKYNENKLNEILQIIRDEGFSAAAKKFSISPSATSGGELGWIPKKSLTKKYLDKIENIKIKEVSKPIINNNSVTILMINKIKNNNTTLNTDELKAQILKKKREEKLFLFSRSHFSNLENKTQVNFQ